MLILPNARRPISRFPPTSSGSRIIFHSKTTADLNYYTTLQFLFGYPLTTPNGFNLATNFAKPALTTTSTTLLMSL